jgi:transcriptional regulator with XRE-family HTH domain
MSSQRLNPLAIDAELADRLEHDERFRRRYIRFFAQTEVAAEIRALRKKRRLRQAEVAKLAKTGQSAISRIEKAGYDGWTFKTLLAIAEELRARLRITFEPIEDVANGYRNTTITNTGVVFGDGAGTGKDAAVTSVESTIPMLFPKQTSTAASTFVM